VNLELLEHLLQFRVIVRLVRQSDHLLVEYLAVFFDSLVGIAIGVHTDEESFEVEVFKFFALPDSLKGFAHLHKGDWAHIWAKGEPEVYQVVLSFKVFMCEWFTLSVIEEPRSTYISLARIRCFLLLLLCGTSSLALCITLFLQVEHV